jgi:hypothetical protein
VTLLPLDHLAVLSDDVGVIQHAVENIPNRESGYCTDDMARAFIVACRRLHLAPHDEFAAGLASNGLAFLAHAQLDDGRFHNFMAYDRTWLDAAGSQDSWGRALWALGFGMHRAPHERWRRVCRRSLERGLHALDALEHLRARAYAMLGLAAACDASKEAAFDRALRHLAGAVTAAFDAASSTDWPWFETAMTYDNARLAEALIRAGCALGDARYGETGLKALDFYERVTIEDGRFVPIGNEGWYPRGGPRARYAQQPLEACALIDAELAAFEATSDQSRLLKAEIGLAWYFGKNTRSVVMARGGGCCDGLHEDGVNTNMGAESTLALLAAADAMAERKTESLRAVQGR